MSTATTITVRELLNAFPSLLEMLRRKLPVAVAYRLRKGRRAWQAAYDAATETRQALWDEHGLKDERGQLTWTAIGPGVSRVEIDPARRAEYDAAFAAFADETAEATVQAVAADMTPPGLELEGEILDHLITLGVWADAEPPS